MQVIAFSVMLRRAEIAGVSVTTAVSAGCPRRLMAARTHR
jgi:hypothetical protein